MEENRYKHTRYDLKQMQSLPLQQKIMMTKRRIQEWYDHWDGDVYVSFSGGKDSTVLLHLVRSIYPDVKAVFSNTGLEYPEIVEFVKKFDNVDIIRPKMNFKKVIQTYGYPVASKEISRRIYYYKKGSKWAKKFIDGYEYNGAMSRFVINKRWKKLLDSECDFDVSDQCCYIMKKYPLKSYERGTGLKPIIGSTCEESNLREQAWMHTGCNSFDGSHVESKPLSFWTNQDILQYIKDNNLEISSIYGDIVECDGKLKTSKMDRTGCMFCMYGAHLEKHPNRFERMKETHPKLYEYCMKPMEDGGLGLDKVLTYCDIKH